MCSVILRRAQVREREIERAVYKVSVKRRDGIEKKSLGISICVIKINVSNEHSTGGNSIGSIINVGWQE